MTADFLFAELIVVASPTLMGTSRLPLDAVALARYPLLDDGQANWSAVLDGQPALQVLPMNQAALAIDAAQAGQGVAMVNRRFVREALDSGQLLQVLAKPVQSDCSYYLVIPTRSRTDAALLTVGEWLKTLASDTLASV